MSEQKKGWAWTAHLLSLVEFIERFDLGAYLEIRRRIKAFNEYDLIKAELDEAAPLLEAVKNASDLLHAMAFFDADDTRGSFLVIKAAFDYRAKKAVDEMKAEPGKVRVKYISTCPRCGLPTEHDDIIKPGDKFWSPETGPCEAVPAGEEGRKK